MTSTRARWRDGRLCRGAACRHGARRSGADVGGPVQPRRAPAHRPAAAHDRLGEAEGRTSRRTTYYPADFVWNGQTIHNTGIRSRGLGSRSGVKPGLRVDFDRYATRQDLPRVEVARARQPDAGSVGYPRDGDDEACSHASAFPTPRETHTRLYVNDHYVGVYALVESIDKNFLARIFGAIEDDTQNDGYLYEFDYLDPWTFSYLGSDLAAYAARFDPKTHENKSAAEKFGPIENLVRLANELPSSQFLSALGEHLDLQAFVRYMAGQNFVGQNDGFLGYAGMNNFYFYRLENSSRHVFLPWDEDNAFWGIEFPIDMRHEENVLMRKAMEVPELSDALSRRAGRSRGVGERADRSGGAAVARVRGSPADRPGLRRPARRPGQAVHAGGARYGAKPRNRRGPQPRLLRQPGARRDADAPPALSAGAAPTRSPSTRDPRCSP